MSLVSETSGVNAIYLVQLFQGFMEYGKARGVKSFPQLFSGLWHELFYKLKEKHPAEFKDFVFLDSGRDQISRDVDNASHGLQFVCEELCADHRIVIAQGVLPVRNGRFFSAGLPPPKNRAVAREGQSNFDEMVESAFEIARKIDGFLEY